MRGGAYQVVAVSGGFVEVSDDHVIILADSAEKSSDIDMERARSSAERAQRRIAEGEGDVDFNRATEALERANNRLKVRGQLK